MQGDTHIDLVVSHNQEASKSALQVVDWIESQGYFGWADVKAFYSPINAAENQIARAFSEARVICLFVGENFRNTRWCQEEYALGLRSEQDLSISRVITIHEGDGGKALIPALLSEKPTFPCTSFGLEGVIAFLGSLPDCTEKLFEWTRNKSSDRGSLLLHLPVEERIKLVVEHVEFLVRCFAMGTFEQGSERHARQLGLVGSSVSGDPIHLSPALCIEHAWNKVCDIIGKYRVNALFASSAVELENDGSISQAVAPLLRLPPLFCEYLSIARTRRSPPENTEAELVSVVSNILCGVCLLCTRSGIPESTAFRDAAEVVSCFCGNGSRVSRCAEYIRENLPDMASPENSVSRKLAMDYFLRGR